MPLVPSSGSGLLGGFASGINQGLQSFIQTRRDLNQDDRDKQKFNLELAAKGYRVNPDTNDLEMTDDARTRLLNENEEKQIKTYTELFGKAGDLRAKGIMDPDLDEAISRYRQKAFPSTAHPQLDSEEIDIPEIPDSGGNAAAQGLLASQGTGLIPKTQTPQNKNQGFQPVPGYKSPEQRQMETELRKQQMQIDGENRRHQSDLEKEDRKRQFEESPQGRFNKADAGTKQKLGFLTGALQNLTDYENEFRKGSRQSYINPDTPVVGGLMSARPIDIARANITESIGRLESGGAINKDEVASFKKMLPTPADKDPAAASKLIKLRRELENKLQGYGIPVENLNDIGFEPKSRGYGTPEAALPDRGLLKKNSKPKPDFKNMTTEQLQSYVGQ